MTPWKIWKSGFDRWETITAEYLETSLQKPSFLGPSATMLGVFMKAKIRLAKVKERGLSKLGITTREERERALHKINQLESQVLDLQEELEEIRNQSRGRQ